MILYSLHCACGHDFDQWFDNMADYDTKASAGHITCPTCQGHEVGKAIMAPRVGKSQPSLPPMPSCASGGCAPGMCPMMAGI